MGMNKIDIIDRDEERRLLDNWFETTSFDKPSKGVPKVRDEEDEDDETKADAFELESKVRHVRTPAGVRRYGQPIGTIIVAGSPLRNLTIRDRVYTGWERVSDSRGNEYDVGKRGNRWIATRAGEWDELEWGGSADEVFRALDARAGRGGGTSVPKPRAARTPAPTAAAAPSRAKTTNYTRVPDDDPNYEKYQGADGNTYWAVQDPSTNEWVLLDDNDNELDSAKSKTALLKKLNTRAAAPEAPAAQPARTPRAARATTNPVPTTSAPQPAAVRQRQEELAEGRAAEARRKRNPKPVTGLPRGYSGVTEHDGARDIVTVNGRDPNGNAETYHGYRTANGHWIAYREDEHGTGWTEEAPARTPGEAVAQSIGRQRARELEAAADSSREASIRDHEAGTRSAADRARITELEGRVRNWPEGSGPGRLARRQLREIDPSNPLAQPKTSRTASGAAWSNEQGGAKWDTLRGMGLGAGDEVMIHGQGRDGPTGTPQRYLVSSRRRGLLVFTNADTGRSMEVGGATRMWFSRVPEGQQSTQGRAAAAARQFDPPTDADIARGQRSQSSTMRNISGHAAARRAGNPNSAEASAAEANMNRRMPTAQDTQQRAAAARTAATRNAIDFSTLSAAELDTVISSGTLSQAEEAVARAIYATRSRTNPRPYAGYGTDAGMPQRMKNAEVYRRSVANLGKSKALLREYNRLIDEYEVGRTTPQEVAKDLRILSYNRGISTDAVNTLRMVADSIDRAHGKSTFATEVKDFIDGFEEKAVRYVRTRSGEQRFGQPIGSIIVRDGAAPLSNLRAVAGNRLQGSDGTRYRIGQANGRWEARAEGGNEAVVHGDSQEQVLTRLNNHAADNESHSSNNHSSGDSGSSNAPTRQHDKDHAEHGEAYKGADGKTYYIKGEDDDYVIRDKDGNVIGKKRDKGEALKELERYISSSTGAGPEEAPSGGNGDNGGGGDPPNAPSGSAPSGAAPNTPANQAAIQRQLQRMQTAQLRAAARRNGLPAGPQATRESLIATLLKFLIRKLLGRDNQQQQAPANQAAYGALLELKEMLEELEEKIRHVRTAAGAARYGVPIGTPIPEGGKPRLGAGIASKPKRGKLSPEMRSHRDGFRNLHTRLSKKPGNEGMTGSVMSLIEQIDAGEITNEDQLMGVVARIFTPDQFAVLLANTKSIQTFQEVKTLIDVKADKKEHTGAMIALIPTREDARRLVDKEGEDQDELHVTLAFLGKAADISESARYAIIGRIAGLAGNVSRPGAEAFAVNVFNPNGEEPCVVMGVNGKGPGLNDLHNHTMMALGDVEAGNNWHMPDQHSPWIPHITLRYFPEGELDADWLMEQFDKTGPVEFDRIRVAFGGNNIDFPLYDGMVKGEDKAMPSAGKCEYCEADATKRIVYAEGRGVIFACPRHMRKAKNFAAEQTPDGTSDAGNIDSIRDVKKLVITPGGRVGDDSSRNLSPRDNWVDKRGGLPKYIRTIANGIREKRGTTEGRAIALAVAAVKRWASGRGNVSPKVRAAAAAAVAQWEAMKGTKGIGAGLSGASGGSAGVGAAPAKKPSNSNYVSDRMAEGGRIAGAARQSMSRDPSFNDKHPRGRGAQGGQFVRKNGDTAGSLSNAMKKRLPIAYGQQGPVVKQVQILVGKMGFPTEEDGIFGEKTKAAVKAAQKKLGLKPTGIIDEETFTALMSNAKPSKRKS